MKSADLSRQVADQIIQMMEQDGIAWVKRWQVPLPPCNAITGTPYRGSNVLTTAISMMAHEWSDPRFVSRSHLFKTRTPIGTVRKGEKGTPIFFYDTAKRENYDGEVTTYRFVKVYYLWNVEQLDNVDHKRLIPRPEPRPQNDAQRLEEVEIFVASTRAVVREGVAPAYSPQQDAILMPPLSMFTGERPAEHYYSTLLHELTHWTGHNTRLDRLNGSRFGSAGYAYEELIAELGSVMLGMLLDVQIAPREDNAAYIKGWITALKSDPSYIMKAAADANRAITFLNEINGLLEEAA